MTEDKAVIKQSAPHGKGRDITTLAKEVVFTEPILIPERGYLTIRQWILSSLAYVKLRTSGLPMVNNSAMDPVELRAAIIRDLESRAQMGEKKYGERLRAFNGRDPQVDLLQELYDALVYDEQHIEEQTTTK